MQTHPRKHTLMAMILAMGLGAFSSVQASDFYVQSKWVETDSTPYESCGEYCPSVDYQLIHTGHMWLDSVINKDVLAIIDVLDEHDPNSAIAKQTKAFYDKPLVTDRELARELNRITNNLIGAVNTARAEDSIYSYSVMARPSMIGMHKGLALMRIDGNVYTGWAHDLPSSYYYVFDLTNKKLLTLDDIIIAGQQDALEQMLYAKFYEYLIEMEVEPSEIMNSWDFTVTDNFMFDETGVEFLYQPYEITPYVFGMPSLHLSYAELKGILKSQYLK